MVGREYYTHHHTQEWRKKAAAIKRLQRPTTTNQTKNVTTKRLLKYIRIISSIKPFHFISFSVCMDICLLFLLLLSFLTLFRYAISLVILFFLLGFTMPFVCSIFIGPVRNSFFFCLDFVLIAYVFYVNLL